MIIKRVCTILTYDLMTISAWSICIVLSWKSKIVQNLAKVAMPSIELITGPSSKSLTMTTSRQIENILDLENAGNIILELSTCAVLNVSFKVYQDLAAYLSSLGMISIFDFVINSRPL